MKNPVIHRAETRGHAFHGWLDAYHTFSFANYYERTRVRFGALRVLNDDRIAPGMGFASHPHDNMEIVTIPLEGALRHQDDMGNGSVIRKGDIQVMSAGTGVNHSEYNASVSEPVKLLQIWVYPNVRGAKPRYDQKSYLPFPKNAFKQIVSPNPDDEGSWIHQDAWFHLGKFSAGSETAYEFRRNGNGAYVFMISGSAIANGTPLSKRDGAGFEEVSGIEFSVAEDSEILVMEVPMET